MSTIKLYNDDCFSVLKDIGGGSVDIVITDPPYGMNFQSHRRKDIYNKIKNDTNLDFLDEYFKECYRILKDNTAIYCFCSWHNVDIFKQSIEKYFKLKNIIVWVKNNHGSGDLQASYAPKHEFVLYANKGRRKFENGRNEDVFFFSKTGNEYHPTQKPVDMLEFMLENSSKENDVCFDGFMGSGSTGVACKNKHRNFIGVESDENYFKTAQDRLNSTKTKGH